MISHFSQPERLGAAYVCVPPLIVSDWIMAKPSTDSDIGSGDGAAAKSVDQDGAADIMGGGGSSSRVDGAAAAVQSERYRRMLSLRPATGVVAALFRDAPPSRDDGRAMVEIVIKRPREGE